MKFAKRLAGLLLAMIMLLTMGVTSVFADGSDKGSIKITNATVGKSYSAYKVFDLTYSENDGGVSYTYTDKGNSDKFLNALRESDSPFALALTTTYGVYGITLKEGKTPSDVSVFLKNQVEKLEPVDTKTAESSELTFDNLDYGYYFVTSELGTVLTIDSTLPNVEVIDKNQKPDWDNGDDKPGKVIVDADGNKVTENTVNYGDVVNFSIAIDATAYVEDKQVAYYYITDTLASGFTSAINIVVKVNGDNIDETAYTITRNQNDDGSNTFGITLPYKEAYGANAKIEVTYSAVVLDTAVLAEGGNLNSANFAYDTREPGQELPDPNPDPKFPSENEKITRTYVYALGIVKVDSEGNTLEGAEFSVTDDKGGVICAKATGEAGVYEYCAPEDPDAINQFATDDKGILVIKGLAAGIYNVTEVVAPDGYNLLSGPIKMEATLGTQYTTKITAYLDENGQVTDTQTDRTIEYEAGVNVAGLVVVNNKGAELPSTGGMGTTLFYALGGMLAVGAAVLLVVKKRMDRTAH